MESTEQRLAQSRKRRSIFFALLFVGGLVLYFTTGLNELITPERVKPLANHPLTPLFIVLSMAAAWTFALPGSVFFFVTPLLFAPPEATLIICAGSAAGTFLGYGTARFVGGPWVERFHSHRISQFLSRHSSFASLFAIRIFPGSQHGLINYGAGLVKVPILRFLVATIAAIAIKAFLYAKAIEGSVGASNVQEALNWQTVTALSLLGLLALGGHVLGRRKGLQRLS
jgi:uncharacterized membrane protein YdjX (TVP38/TMEM64 family)